MPEGARGGLREPGVEGSLEDPQNNRVENLSSVCPSSTCECMVLRGDVRETSASARGKRGARRSQEEPGGPRKARSTQEEPGEARRDQGEPWEA